MPVSINKLRNGSYRVTTPGSVKAKHTTRGKAERQARLLRAVDHGWVPTGKHVREFVESRLDPEEVPAFEPDVEDAALDYVEQILGRRYFREHWARLSAVAKHVSVEAWLTRTRRTAPVDAVLRELNRLDSVDAAWPR
jgi:hypothetical protein